MTQPTEEQKAREFFEFIFNETGWVSSSSRKLESALAAALRAEWNEAISEAAKACGRMVPYVYLNSERGCSDCGCGKLLSEQLQNLKKPEGDK